MRTKNGINLSDIKAGDTVRVRFQNEGMRLETVSLLERGGIR